MPKQSSRPVTGFTLIEMAIVLVIIGLAAAMVLKASGGILDGQKRQNVRTGLDAVDAALATYVSVNKRLPCPADGRIASGAVNAGVAMVSAGPAPAAGNCNPVNQQFGVVPWVTLGLSELDASDPWAGRLSYRVDPALAGGAPLAALMDMSACDPAATGATAAGACQTPALSCTGSASCTSPANFLANKGLDVWDGLNAAAGFAARQNNRVLGSGAAYVVISHGPSGAGAYNHSGILQPGTIPLDLSDEVPNANGQALAMPGTTVSTYRDGPLNDNAALVVPPPGPVPPPYTLNHFDDYLSHPTIMAVLNKANLGPRAH